MRLHPDALVFPCFYAMYKGCTRDAHQVYQLKSYVFPVSIRCTPLVHGVGAGGMRGMFGVCGSWQDSDFILSLSILKPLILLVKKAGFGGYAVEIAK